MVALDKRGKPPIRWIETVINNMKMTTVNIRNDVNQKTN